MLFLCCIFKWRAHYCPTADANKFYSIRALYQIYIVCSDSHHRYLCSLSNKYVNCTATKNNFCRTHQFKSNAEQNAVRLLVKCCYYFFACLFQSLCFCTFIEHPRITVNFLQNFAFFIRQSTDTEHSVLGVLGARNRRSVNQTAAFLRLHRRRARVAATVHVVKAEEARRNYVMICARFVYQYYTCVCVCRWR